MKDSRNNSKEIEEKYDKYKKDISNEKMFLFRINNLFTNEFEELIEDILILNESQFFIQIKNRVEAELEYIYSEKIFLDTKFNNLIEKGLNSIKSDYNNNLEYIQNVYNNYIENKNFKKGKIKFLKSNYRRHCINEVNNEFALHNCNNKLGKFLLVEKKGKIEFLICSNCKKVYYASMILCKCYKCNKEYYTEILDNIENEFILPATWENYHCKQINQEKIKCIKCREIMCINLKTNMLICVNKNCNFSTKPNKILWTCSICNQDFKSGAMPYNPLDNKIIKKIIKQTLYLKQYAHPNKVPCCKLNVFYTEFYHKKNCDGILYNGELNDVAIIVCEKCHAVNYYERFIWICPKCGNKFRDENGHKNSLSDENSEKSGKLKSYESRKKSDNKDNVEEDISPSSNSSNNKYSRDSKKDRSIRFKETNPFDLEKNNQKTENDKYKINNEDGQVKKTMSSRFKKKLNNIYYEREKEKREKKEKEKIYQNYQTEIGDEDQEQKPEGSRKRTRFYTDFGFVESIKEQPEQENNTRDLNKNEQKRKIEKTPLNIFNKFRKERKKDSNEQKEEKQIQTEIKEQNKEIKINKKYENLEININKDKIKENEDKKNFYRNGKKILPYRSFKRNSANKLQEDLESLNTLKKYKKDEDEDKEKDKNNNKDKDENIEPKRSRQRFLTNYDKSKKENDNFKNKVINQKIEDEKEESEKDKEEEDLNSNKKKIKEIDLKQLDKKEDNNQSSYNRWKFKHSEDKKSLGKEIKEETVSTSNNSNKNSNNISNNKSNKSNNSIEDNNNNSPSPEKNEIKKNKNINNNDNNENDKKKNVKMSKIPGMSENLYNHVNNRINNIISKCSIPLMNVEDYTLVKKIGEGSYGIIFKAVSKKDNQQYAMKKIISNKLQKIAGFIKEFELIYSCHHDNIMKIYSYCIRILDSTTYALYVIMELSEGDWDQEIKQRLKERKNYTEKELINILFQLSSSLFYIQEKFHVSHRDIKPQNVLVFPGSKYKLADFGEAKEAKVMRQRNTLRGTELYMSPALYDGLKHELNDVAHNPFKSDVFSLGFCFIYAAALNFNLLYQVRDIIDSKSINIILHKYLSKIYSEKFIVLLNSMLEVDESKRYDFIDIKTYIEKNFEDMIK